MAMAMDRLPTPRLFRLLVFDWDGTLADSTAIIAGALQQACRDLDLPAPDDAAARFVIGLGLADALRRIAPTLPSAEYPRLSERYREHYLARDPEIPLFGGTREMLDELVDGGAGVRFEVRRAGGSLPAFAIRFRGSVHAYVNECRHQASELDWNPGEFFDAERLYLICATHGALYEPASGVCVDGPCCGASLAVVAVREHDGGVYCGED